MQYAMRRKDRALTENEARELLAKGEYGVMASVDAQGQPYATALSYIVADGAIYFHCAQTGYKTDNIKANPKVCFTVVGATQPVYDKNFTTYYESVVVFGRAAEITDSHEKTVLLMQLAQKYLPGYMDKAPESIAQSLARTAVYRISIDEITGKAKRPKV